MFVEGWKCVIEGSWFGREGDRKEVMWVFSNGIELNVMVMGVMNE